MEKKMSTYISKIDAFDLHRRIYWAMIWLGIYKLHSPNPHLERLHFAYRLFVIAATLVLNLQHLIYMYDVFSSSNALQYEMFIEEISHINFFGKLIALSLNSSKLDAVHTLIEDPIFAPENEKDEQYIKEYKAKAWVLFKIVSGWMAFSIVLWVVNRIVKKIENPNFTIPSYVPFDTSSWTAFICACMHEAFLGIWSGFGHYGLDCMIVSYYLQATSQLKSIKYKLQHVFDEDSVNSMIPVNRSFNYKDELDDTLNERFIYYVRRYGKISWFINHLNTTLNFGILVNFMTLSLAMCMIVYGLGSVNVFSVEFMFMFAALFVYQFQNFMYCYGGHLVQYESDSVNTAIYFSDWLSVSPKFRRQILIAMSRWHYRVIPSVSSVIPVSLTTFAAITRLAYTIYTVMKSYESKSI